MNLTYLNEVLSPKLTPKQLKPNKDGYYSVVLGALETTNNVGHYYVMNNDVLKLFSASSELLYKVKNRRLYPEDNHPKWPAGLDLAAYKELLLETDSDQIVGHVRSVWLDGDLSPEQKATKGVNENTTFIMGEIIPFGFRKQVLQDSLVNPYQDTCFSVRAFSDDWDRGGVSYKALSHIIKWDLVPEPGIDIASKYNSKSAIAMESRLLKVAPEVARWEGSDVRAIMDTLDIKDDNKRDTLALESRRKEVAGLMRAFEREPVLRDEIRSNLIVPNSFNW